MFGISAQVVNCVRGVLRPVAAAYRTVVPATPTHGTSASPTHDPGLPSLQFARETELRDPVAAWLTNTWLGAHVADEVGPRWAPADLVAEAPSVAGTPGALVSVELKLRDSKRALAQATLHQLFADLSYIALPTHRITDAALNEAAAHGIGVLGVDPDGSVKCLTEASPSTPGEGLSATAVQVVRASADGTRGLVRTGGSPGGAPVTAP